MLYTRSGSCIQQPTSNAGTMVIRTIAECKRYGGSWSGFDISGHCFLLIHATLFILEELQDYCRRPPFRPSGQSLFLTYSRASVVAFALLLSVCWLGMLTVTCLYFHTLWEKVWGVLFGFLFWIVTYTGPLYRHPCSPGMPGER